MSHFLLEKEEEKDDDDQQEVMPANHACVSPNSKHMNAFIEDILTRIQDLLELAPPVGRPTYP